MIPRRGFIGLLGGAAIVSACGHQVTPNRGALGTTGLSPGFMSIRFRVQGQFNYSNYNYMMVFNTFGNGITPLPLGQHNSFAGYSFAIIVSAATGTVQATAWQYFRPQGISNTQQPTLLALLTTPQQLQLTINSNGLGNEFLVIFDRNIAFGVTTPTPSPAGATPTPTPSTTPTASPSPSSSPTATPLPTASGFSTTWLVNMFTTNSLPPGPSANLVPLDSLGVGGPTDTTYISPTYDTTQPFDETIIALVGSQAAGGDPNGQIANSEIANSP